MCFSCLGIVTEFLNGLKAKAKIRLRRNQWLPVENGEGIKENNEGIENGLEDGSTIMPGYFWPDIDARQSNLLLKDKQDESESYSLNLSNPSFPRGRSVADLVDKLVTKSRDHNICLRKVKRDMTLVDQGATLKLKFPLHRMQSLKEQCKNKLIKEFTANASVNLTDLNIPIDLIKYLNEI
eukprot:gene17501-19251_t